MALLPRFEVTEPLRLGLRRLLLDGTRFHDPLREDFLPDFFWAWFCIHMGLLAAPLGLALAFEATTMRDVPDLAGEGLLGEA